MLDQNPQSEEPTMDDANQKIWLHADFTNEYDIQIAASVEKPSRIKLTINKTPRGWDNRDDMPSDQSWDIDVEDARELGKRLIAAADKAGSHRQRIYEMPTAHEIVNRFAVQHSVDLAKFREWFNDGGYTEEQANVHDSQHLALLEQYVEERDEANS